MKINTSVENLPEDIKNLVLSSDIYNKLKVIGENNNLLIDQIGVLASETRMVLMGISKSSDYVKNISEGLEIEEKMAKDIAEAVNIEIFNSIRSSLQKIQAENEKIDSQITTSPPNLPTSHEDIEKVGDFTIEKQPSTLETEPEYDQLSHSGELKMEKVLNVLENPDLHNVQPINVLKNAPSIVDHMLGKATEQPVTLEVKPAVVIPPKKTGPDPYREPIQ